LEGKRGVRPFVAIYLSGGDGTSKGLSLAEPKRLRDAKPSVLWRATEGEDKLGKKILPHITLPSAGGVEDERGGGEKRSIVFKNQHGSPMGRCSED